jgi:hypothetical protein
MSWATTHSAFLFALRQAFGTLREWDGGPSSYADAYRVFLERGLSEKEWQPVEFFYRQLGVLGEQHGFSLLVIILPVNDIVSRPQPGSHAYPTQARQLLDRLDIQYIDAYLLWDTRGYGTSHFLPQGADAHLDAEGYRVLADATAEELLGNPSFASRLVPPPAH